MVRKHITPLAAFTLIELSIVLVIIGLIVGGVLVGKDLIKAAEVRMTVAQIEKYKTAVNTFKIKYACIPGDCKNAVTLGLGTAGGPGANGNGDQLVDGSLVGIAGMIEVEEGFDFWYHLSKANLIDGNVLGYPGDNIVDINTYADTANYAPPTKLPGGVFWVSNPYGSYDNGFFIINRLDAFIGPSNGGLYYGALTPYENYMIDNKTDDGLPTTGAIKSYGASSADVLYTYTDPTYFSSYIAPTQGAGGATSNFCVANDNTPYTYNILNTSHDPNTLCILYINGSF